MSIGLILTGICNILFGFSSTILWFVIFFGINGIFQGWGWPPITKQLTHWYCKRERGTWWSIIAISHNVGGAIIPLVVAYYAQLLGWRYAMFIPGVICIIIGLLLFNRLRDVPESLGLPPIEEYKNDLEEIEEIKKSNAKMKTTSKSEQDNASEGETHVLSAKQILFEHVLNNKYIWLLAIAYFYVYVVRTAINDWTMVYLIEVKGYATIAAGASATWFEIGGLVGMLMAGWSTDRFLKGRRASFMIFCSIGMILGVTLFSYLPAVNIFIDYFLLAIIGFMVFGPQMLVGMIAAESVDKKAACTANGFVSCWAYIGAAATGYPMGVLIDISWEAYHFGLIGCCVALMLVLILFVFVSERQSLQKTRDDKFKDLNFDEA